MRLEFGTKRFHVNHWVKESAHGVRILHRWVLNSMWSIFLTRITSLRSELEAQFFCRYAPRYLPRLKGFGFLSRMGPSPFVSSFFIPRLTQWFFNKGGVGNLWLMPLFGDIGWKDFLSPFVCLEPLIILMFALSGGWWIQPVGGICCQNFPTSLKEDWIGFKHLTGHD